MPIPNQLQEVASLQDRLSPARLGEIVPPIVLGPYEVYAYALAAGLRALEDLGIGAGLRDKPQVLGQRHG